MKVSSALTRQLLTCSPCLRHLLRFRKKNARYRTGIVSAGDTSDGIMSRAALYLFDALTRPANAGVTLRRERNPDATLCIK